MGSHAAQFAGPATHADWFPPGLYVFPLHAAHCLFSLSKAYPALHPLHVPSLGKHVAHPVEKLHALHSVPSGLNEPASHAVHVLPLSPNPEAQFAHASSRLLYTAQSVTAVVFK